MGTAKGHNERPEKPKNKYERETIKKSMGEREGGEESVWIKEDERKRKKQQQKKEEAMSWGGREWEKASPLLAVRIFPSKHSSLPGGERKCLPKHK